MGLNKNGIGILVGLLTFIVVKVIFGKVGIENMPAPILIALFTVPYTMFVVGVNKKELTVKEKKFFIICASLLAITCVSVILGVMLIKYIPPQTIGYRRIRLVLLVIAMVSFSGSGLVALIVKKGRS